MALSDTTNSEPSMSNGPPPPLAHHTYLAVECAPLEPVGQVIYEVMTACSEAKVFFRDLTTLGYYPMGSKAMLRIRVDMDPKKLPAFEQAVETATKRKVLWYRDKFSGFSNPKGGKIPLSSMLSPAQPSVLFTFKGTKIKAWRRQFPDFYGTPPAGTDGASGSSRR